MGDEIRRGLEAFFDCEKANPKTQEWLDEFSFVADKTDFYYGNWSEDTFAFEVLKACMDTRLMASRPKGEAVPKADPNPNTDPKASGFINVFFDPNHSPKDISRFIVGELMHAKSACAR